jgi:hypothetical protein
MDGLDICLMSLDPEMSDLEQEEAETASPVFAIQTSRSALQKRGECSRRSPMKGGRAARLFSILAQPMHLRRWKYKPGAELWMRLRR